MGRHRAYSIVGRKEQEGVVSRRFLAAVAGRSTEV